MAWITTIQILTGAPLLDRWQFERVCLERIKLYRKLHPDIPGSFPPGNKKDTFSNYMRSQRQSVAEKNAPAIKSKKMAEMGSPHEHDPLQDVTGLSLIKQNDMSALASATDAQALTTAAIPGFLPV